MRLAAREVACQLVELLLRKQIHLDVAYLVLGFLQVGLDHVGVVNDVALWLRLLFTTEGGFKSLDDQLEHGLWEACVRPKLLQNRPELIRIREMVVYSKEDEVVPLALLL